MKRFIRSGRWLWLLPLFTLGGILVLGHFLSEPPAPTWDPPPPPGSGGTPPPPEREIALRLERPDGSPAAGALAVLLEPDLDSVRADPEGVARLRAAQDGPFRFQAYLPGHRILAAGPMEQTPAKAFRFEADPEVPLEKPEIQVRIDRRLLLQSAVPELTLPPGVLVTAVPAEDPGQPPWLGLGDPAGEAVLAGTRPIALQVSVFAPGLPPTEPWLLGRRRLGPAEGTQQASAWRLPFARLVIAGLPLHGLLTGERRGPGPAAPLPLRWSGDNGEVVWECLPAGSYRFQSGEQARTIELKSGAASLDFSPQQP